MNLYYVAFHGISKVSRVIQFCTRSEYSHVAVCTDVGSMTMIEAWAHNGGWKQWWAVSDMRVHTPGTPYELWGIEVPEDEYRHAMGLYHMWAANRSPYDWRGVLGFELKWVRENKKGFFCSEGTIYPFVKWRRLDSINPAHVSPINFIWILESMGGKMVMTGKA
jgi:hypothetical protein